MGNLCEKYRTGREHSRLRVVWGIDGLEDTNHIYRVGAKWEKIINNAKAFIDAGGIASWQFIEFEHNKHQIEEAKQLAKELGFKEFRLVSSTRPTMTESLEHIRKDNKVSARSNRVPEKKEVILSDKKESEEETMVPCSTSKPKKPVQELVLIRKKTKKQNKNVSQALKPYKVVKDFFLNPPLLGE